MKGLIEEMNDTGYEYECSVANRFGELLDDETDPFELLQQARERRKEEKVKTPSAPPPTTVKESQRDRKVPLRAAGDTAANINRGIIGLTHPVHGQPEERAERRVAFNEPRFSEGDNFLRYSVDRPRELFDRAGRGGGRGHGARGAGYPRSTDGFDPRGKREFERHSGSDRASVRPEEKRGGNGPRNWGSMKDHISAMADALPNEEIVESEDALETDGENQPLEKEVIEVAMEMSLDEWKSMQEQSRPKTEFNIRKADTKLPSKAVVIHKSKHIEKHADGIVEDVVFRHPANDITFQLEIDFGNLARPSRGGRGGRGGRGRGRGVTAPQRSPEKTVDVAPNPEDPEDFPALA
ncbi:intracellular hyaluronan-binding protein 4 [Pygocentrus nattereri]|uniref:Hyaluronan/mRNA-binding protein domain-containing protein n=1 Tax=Pygocentrus nattereri TaxID=42514 RepID=A0A3B4DQQ0_PYGNA|nr:intracellular hyaluronan-binding protein 4 [Pygocentrus nattereri]